MAASNLVEQFINDDDAYLAWLAKHPSGYVVNSNREPDASYLVLHRASCETINTGSRNNWTTTGFIKTCSDDVAALEAWAWQAASGHLRPCGSCNPRLSRPQTDLFIKVKPGTPPTLPPDLPKSAPAPVTTPPLATKGAAAPPPLGSRGVPESISTGCPELDRAWSSYAAWIMNRPEVPIPDTEDDLNWHAFLGHSIDMQGFRAAEFAGVDALTRQAPEFVPLRKRGIGIPELAALWEVPEIRQHLLGVRDDMPLDTTLKVLEAHGGAVGKSLAEAFRHFPWRKFHWSVRALLQNSSALKPFDYSFRKWLENECSRLGASQFPPVDFRQPVTRDGASLTLEQALKLSLAQAFYMVGPAMSAYMICDWQLGLWKSGRTAVFANFKLDSFHEAFVKSFGRGIIPSSEAGFAKWWLGLYQELPPRLANECIWLSIENKQVNPW